MEVASQEPPAELQQRRRTSLFLKLMVSFSLLSSIAIAVVAVMAYILARDALKESTFERLNVAVAIKDDEIGQWLNTQRQDVLMVAQLPAVQAGTSALVLGANNASNQDKQLLSSHFKKITQIKPNLQEASILSPGGIVLFATDPNLKGRYQPLGATTTYFTASETQFRPTFYLKPETQKTAISFATPILDLKGDRLGALSIALDLQEIDGLVRNRTGLGKTGETYLVGRLENTTKFLFSNQQDNRDYQDEINSLGIQAAIEGKQGQGLYKNYKGIPVVGVYRWLGDRNLALLAEISQEEAFAPAHALARQIFSIGFGSVVVLLVIVYLLSRFITQPIRAITKVAIAMGRGNLNRRAPVTSHDEIGVLAHTLNHTAELLLRSQQQVAHYTETLKTKNERLELTLNQLQQTQSQLIQSEKMSGLGQMVAGIAHEINNPVSFVHGNIDYAENYFRDLLSLLELYREEFPNATPALVQHMEDIEFEFLKKDSIKLLESMKIGTERIRKIVLSLRNFSRLDEAELKAVDLHDGLDSTLLILNHRINNRVEIIQCYGAIPLVECHPAQINQVFMNILSNALDALETVQVESPQISIRTTVLKDNQVQIRISNNGPAIPEEIQAKLFDPFFTTKPIGKGTGIGLGICYQIIRKHHGIVAVESSPALGVAFTVTLPIAQIPSAPLTLSPALEA